MEKRIQEQPVELFKKLGIPSSVWPHYENQEQFAWQIKKCSLLEPCEISFSDTTALSQKDAQ